MAREGEGPVVGEGSTPSAYRYPTMPVPQAMLQADGAQVMATVRAAVDRRFAQVVDQSEAQAARLAEARDVLAAEEVAWRTLDAERADLWQWLRENPAPTP